MHTDQLTNAQFLGAAKILRIDGARLLLAMNDKQAWACSAVGYPYSFQVDDVVLAIGQLDDWYVIGVLHGSGKTSLQVPGDLQLIAPCGSIELVAAKGITLRSPTVQIVATRLHIAAKKLRERFEQASCWVTGGLNLVAKRMTTKVGQSYRLSAGKIVERAAGDVKIDGNKIHLG
jgi:hypothetical protein